MITNTELAITDELDSCPLADAAELAHVAVFSDGSPTSEPGLACATVLEVVKFLSY